MLTAMILLAMANLTERDPTSRYIDCIKGEVVTQFQPERSNEEIASLAVENCEHLAAASAQVFVNEMSDEEIATWHAVGRTDEMILERQIEIGRNAGRQMASGIVEDLRKGREPQ